MTVYELMMLQRAVEYKDRSEISTGCCIDQPQVIASDKHIFNNEKDALDELNKHNPSCWMFSTPIGHMYEVEEWVVEF